MDVTAHYANGSVLILTNATQITFELPIQQVLHIQQVLLVILAVPIGIGYNENVFAFDLQGDFLWRISLAKNLLFYAGTNCPFIAAESCVNQEDHVRLFNWCDTALIVHAQTGEILDRYQTK